MNELFEKSKLEDPIHNSRKLCEIVLVEWAKYYSLYVVKDDEITRNEKPIRIREYLDKKIIFLKMNLI